ncbi:hypothetical protein LguiB_021026 [Lonicera macranthoides]
MQHAGEIIKYGLLICNKSAVLTLLNDASQERTLTLVGIPDFHTILKGVNLEHALGIVRLSKKDFVVKTPDFSPTHILLSSPCLEISKLWITPIKAMYSPSSSSVTFLLRTMSHEKLESETQFV